MCHIFSSPFSFFSFLILPFHVLLCFNFSYLLFSISFLFSLLLSLSFLVPQFSFAFLFLLFHIFLVLFLFLVFDGLVPYHITLSSPLFPFSLSNLLISSFVCPSSSSLSFAFPQISFLYLCCCGSLSHQYVLSSLFFPFPFISLFRLFFSFIISHPSPFVCINFPLYLDASTP